jgi:sugar O-acyltransferase (sialic acid O-acetyltransferase NeuD family)
MKKRDLIIVGAGGFGREIMWLVQDIGDFNLLGFIDDSQKIGNKISGIEILGGVADAAKYTHAEFVVAIGSPRTRQKIVSQLEGLGIKKFAVLVHPSVKKSNSVIFGEGSMICAGTILTVDVQLGKHNIVNINCTVGHDCKSGDYCTVAPIVAISGNVTMGDLVEVGTGAAIRQGARLEKGSMLGMGGVLTKDIPLNQIFVGNPAKFLKEL